MKSMILDKLQDGDVLLDPPDTFWEAAGIFYKVDMSKDTVFRRSISSGTIPQLRMVCF